MTWARNIQAENALTATPQAQPSIGEWDYVSLGGEVCPGIARVDVKVPSGLDIQKPKGSKKATTVDNGEPPIELRITIRLQPDEVQEFFDFILPTLRPRSKTGGRDPLTIEHPMCSLIGVDKITVGPIDIPQPTAGQLMAIKIDAFEWTAGPSQSKSKGKVQDSGGSSKTPPKVPAADPPDFADQFGDLF